MKFKQFLYEATKEEFFNLAKLQRSKPEDAMLKIQTINGGGVLNVAVEHIGDLIHRMTEPRTFESAGYSFVKEKVKYMLRLLKNPYGFGKEVSENMKNNAEYLKINYEEFRSKVFEALEQYAKEHEKLPTYNKAQTLARDAAISLGKLNIPKTIKCLEELDSHLATKEDWITFAHENLT